MSKLVARDVMTTDVLVAQADWSLATVAELFVENGISGAPVVDEDGVLLGVISTSDLARHAADSSQEDELEPPRERNVFFQEPLDARLSNEDMRQLQVHVSKDVTVRELMTPAVFSVPEDTPVSDIAGTMIQGRIHRVLVIDDSKVAGIITSLDLLKLLLDDTGA